MRQTFKILIAITFLVGIFGFYSKPAYAITCTNTGTSGDSADPSEIVCPLARVINILLMASGAVLIIMILFGGVKLAMAMGDPKGMQAASGTWTWAIVGFLVVVGAITILIVVGKLIGWQYQDPLDALQTAITQLMTALGVH